ncbi:MAG TPA: hypothetical protein VEB19_07445 [Gemmatimonadaceae bacterium]|nr:hypothetical protein [Gemmatimonadaceae bacterium]
MYTRLAQAVFNAGGVTPAQAMDVVLTQLTAEQVAYYTDRVWEQPRSALRNLLPGANALQNLQHEAWSVDIDPDPAAVVPAPPPTSYFRHIAYAYLLESTNIEAVMRRVVQEWVTGEKLPFPTLPTHVWLRTTEQLFFTNPQPPSIRSLTSDIRPDRGGIRRNAYYRLLGFELPGSSQAFIKPDVANRELLRAWEQLLRETWQAYMNRLNLIGPNSTDLNALVDLVREIRDMLTARRMNGALSREEFDAVRQFSWFHLSVLGNTQIVANLNAISTSSAMRLKKIADLVNVPIHSKTDSFFQMAFAMARILELIETGMVNVGNIQQLYVGVGVIANSMRALWTHWPQATGRAVKGLDDARAQAALRSAPVPASMAVLPSASSRLQPVMR